MEKAAVFIDAGYLNRVLKENFQEPRINYALFSENICKLAGLHRLRTYFYYCKPFVRKNNLEDQRRADSLNKFLQSLKRLPRFEVRLGRLQFIGGVYKQKMVDVLMSLDLVNMCFEGHIDHAILIAGDSDFVPAIDRARECGAIIHLFYHPSSVHENLLDQVDERYKIDDALINNSKG